MLKGILIAAALLIAGTASAGDLSTVVKYDYDRAQNLPVWASTHTGSAGLKYDIGGSIGAVDASAVGEELVSGTRSNTIGYEVGYSNGLSIGPVGLSGRVGYRQLQANNVVVSYSNVGVDLNGHLQSWRLSAEATLPVTSNVTGFVGFERDLNKATGTANFVSGSVKFDDSRYTIGADVALTSRLSLRAGYAREQFNIVSQQIHTNGLTTAVSYKF